MKNNIENRDCTRYDNTADILSSTCSICEETVAHADEKQRLGFGKTFFSTLYSLALIVSIILILLVLSVNVLNTNATIPEYVRFSDDPDIIPASGDWISMFLNSVFDAWYVPVLGAILVLNPLLVIAVINARRIRNFFLFAGVSLVLTIPIGIMLTLIVSNVLKRLPGDLWLIIRSAADAIKEFGIVCSIILAILGAICLSIYLCIRAIKGVKHKNISESENTHQSEEGLLCPNCGYQTATNTRFCKQCGYDFNATPVKLIEHVCAKCGQHYEGTEAYCTNCGAMLIEE